MSSLEIELKKKIKKINIKKICWIVCMLTTESESSDRADKLLREKNVWPYDVIKTLLVGRRVLKWMKGNI